MQIDRGFRRVAGFVSLGLNVAGLVAATALMAAHPAAAASSLAAIASAVSCATSAGCVSGNNTSAGSGVTGTSTSGSGMTASGVTGITATGTTGPGISASASNGPGILAASSGSVGIKGSSNLGYGVEAASNKNYGVVGMSLNTSKAGVYGTAAGGAGVYGTVTGSGGYGVSGSSVSGDGVYGTTASGSGIGVVGAVSGFGIGTEGQTSTGYGVQGFAASGAAVAGAAAGGIGLYGYDSGYGVGGYIESYATGVNAYTYSGNDAIVAKANYNANGAFVVADDQYGTAIWGRSNNYPLALTDGSNNDIFYVDGSGDVFYKGNLYNEAYPFPSSAGKKSLRTFTAKSALPTVEDTGTAQLVAGAAAVQLDPTFAGTIDPQSSYRVFLTPDGDTNGLYVASKTATGFIVRESQSGRSTFSFDYRIVAMALGRTGQRMAVLNAPFGPHLNHSLPAKRPVPHPLSLHK